MVDGRLTSGPQIKVPEDGLSYVYMLRCADNTVGKGRVACPIAILVVEGRNVIEGDGSTCDYAFNVLFHNTVGMCDVGCPTLLGTIKEGV